MGQANGKEKGEGSTHAVDGGELVPQGVYSAAQDYDHTVVKAFIQSRRIAPFYRGLDDEDAYAQAPYNTECPICFLYYPSPLNHTRCCSQPICTECFVQIKRADPTHTNPPSSEPAMCPYCQETEFGVVYKPPPPGLLTGESKMTAAGVGESASAIREQAEEIAEGSQQHKRRKSFSAKDPNVVTIDAVRPDWQAKLLAAEAATLRRANRRIIMRQVGDRLIPVGISSARLGAELPPGSTTGPGGAIIIGENTRWGGSERRTGRGRRGGEIAQLLQTIGGGAVGGPDMEEIMMMEAMRLSLLEHEDQQRRQAQAQSQGAQQPAAAEGDATVDSGNRSAPAVVPESSLQQQQQQSPSSAALLQPRRSSLASDSTPSSAGPPASAPAFVPIASSTNPHDLGISSSMMAELAELVEGGLNLPTSSAASASPLTDASPSPPAATAPAAAPSAPTAGQDPRASPMSMSRAPRPTSVFAAAVPTTYSTTPDQFHSPSQSPVHTPTYGSPVSRIGTNPNNPFRRASASASAQASPTHSRHTSTSHVPAASRNYVPGIDSPSQPPTTQ